MLNWIESICSEPPQRFVLSPLGASPLPPKEQNACAPRSSLVKTIATCYCNLAERDFTLNTEFNKHCGSYAFQRFRSMALMHAQKNEHLHFLTTIGSKNMSSFARKLLLPNGEEYYFDAVVCEDDHFLFVKVFSDSERITGIPAFEKMDFAASQIAPLYKSNYIVYSVRPFKQRVKQYVSKQDYLKVYCLEQL